MNSPRPDMHQIGDLWTPVNTPAPRVRAAIEQAVAEADRAGKDE